MNTTSDWHIAGDWFDNCSCAVACPCTFAQPPDNGFGSRSSSGTSRFQLDPHPGTVRRGGPFASADMAHQFPSTMRRELGILVDVHPGLLSQGE